MRIGYIFNSPEIIGGGEISLIDLADAIREFGVDAVPVVPGPSRIKTELEAKGMEVVETSFPPIRLSSLLPLFRRLEFTQRYIRELIFLRATHHTIPLSSRP